MLQTETIIEDEVMLGDEPDVVGINSGIIEVPTEVHEAVDGDILGSFGLNGTLFTAQLINFTIVLFVMWKFAYKPLLKLMKERTEKIEQGLKHAQDMEERIKQLENEKEEILSTARGEAQSMVMEATELSEKNRADSVAMAKSEVEKVVATGRAQIAVQKEQMMVELKEEISALVVEAARKVAGSAIDIKKAEANASSAIKSAAKDL